MRDKEKISSDLSKERIIFFDGVCNLCNSFVDFMIRRDRGGQLKFASLQGEAASRLLKGQFDTEKLSTVLFYDQGKVFRESRAVFRAMSYLPVPWSVFKTFSIVPTFISDFFYRWVASNRYALFGKKDSCRLPLPEERKYFLD